MAHIWMSHGTHMNESCHTYEWFESYDAYEYDMSRIWHTYEHGTHMNMAHIWIWHTYDHNHMCAIFICVPYTYGTHMNESCHIWHTYEYGTHMNIYMAHIWSYVCHIHMCAIMHVEYGTHMNESCHTHMNESWHTYEWVMAHIWMSHVIYHKYEYGTHMHMAHTNKQDVSRIWLSHITNMIAYAWVQSHIWMSHVTHMNKSCHTYEWVMSHIWMIHVIHLHESYDAYECAIWKSQPLEQLLGQHKKCTNLSSSWSYTHTHESCHT